MTDKQKDILMVSREGMCIRFQEEDVRPTGRNSMGVIGMTLSESDEVVAMQLHTQGKYLLLVSENGLGKRTNIEEFTAQHRGGKGVKCYKIMGKTGSVVGAKALDEENEIMLITTEGIVIRLRVSDISVLGRITSGVKLMNIDSESETRIASIARVRQDETEAAEELTEELTEELPEEKYVDNGIERMLEAAKEEETEENYEND